MVVMSWEDEKEQAVVLDKLHKAITAQGIKSVILFGTCSAFRADLSQTLMLFGSIHVPQEPIYTVAALFKIVDDKPVFTEEMDSSHKAISPWQVTPFWEEGDNTPKPWVN
jgi:hypothetical protein